MRLPINKRISYLGILLAFCLILGFLESILPLNFAVPGIKIGLSNLPVVLCLYLFSPVEAFMLSIIKAVLNGFLFGNGSMLIYSLSGAMISALGMIMIKKIKSVHLPVVSAVGGVLHNIGQLIVACFVIGVTAVLYYLPLLIVSGMVTGILLGVVGGVVLRPIKKVINKGDML